MEKKRYKIITFVFCFLTTIKNIGHFQCSVRVPNDVNLDESLSSVNGQKCLEPRILLQRFKRCSTRSGTFRKHGTVVKIFYKIDAKVQM